MISVNVSSATGFIYAFMQQPNLILLRDSEQPEQKSWHKSGQTNSTLVLNRVGLGTRTVPNLIAGIFEIIIDDSPGPRHHPLVPKGQPHSISFWFCVLLMNLSHHFRKLLRSQSSRSSNKLCKTTQLPIHPKHQFIRLGGLPPQVKGWMSFVFWEMPLSFS